MMPKQDREARFAARLMISLLLSWIAFACSPQVFAQTLLHIAAAADLQPVLPGILVSFEQMSNIHAEATYQASATLTAQIGNGAPFDLFLSADLSYPQRLIDSGKAEGLIQPKVPTTYACGTLVLWTRKDSHWPNATLDTLSDPNLKRIAIANPDRAPYGRAAVAAIASLKLTDNLQPKLVTAENIAQAAQFAETGNTDAGLISLTTAKTEHLTRMGSYFVVPVKFYPPIEQGAVLISNSLQRRSAQKFLEYLLSAPIQQQLLKSGLTPVK